MTFSLWSTFVQCDAAEPWQIGFQDGASPTFEGITELHNAIFFYLVLIFIGVMWVIGSVVINYSSTSNPISHKYSNHGTLIELVWTITPALILIAIAFPSFKLLYLMDIFSNNSLVFTCTVMIMSVVPIKIKKSRGKIIPNNTCTDIVVYGSVGSGIKLGRMNWVIADFTYFPPIIVSQLIGHLLGDGSLTKSYTSTFCYFVFTQTVKQFKYTWHVFEQLKHYCNSVPLWNMGLRKGVSYPFTQILTRSYPYLMTLYNLFYKQENGKMVKFISDELIIYLNPVVLAYWAIDDGAFSPNGFTFHTEGFTLPEIYKLAGMLHYVFGLNCTVQKHDSKHILRVRAQSMVLFRSIVEPHFYQSMLYKLYKT